MKNKKMWIGIIVAIIVIAVIAVACYFMFFNKNNPSDSTVNNKEPLNLSEIATRIDALEDTEGPYFYNLVEADATFIKESMGINTELLDAYIIKQPLINVSSVMYFILKPKEGKKAEVEAQVDKYFEDYRNSGAVYLPTQMEMLDNKQKAEKDGYLIYVVSENSQKAIEAIKNELK